MKPILLGKQIQTILLKSRIVQKRFLILLEFSLLLLIFLKIRKKMSKKVIKKSDISNTLMKFMASFFKIAGLTPTEFQIKIMKKVIDLYLNKSVVTIPSIDVKREDLECLLAIAHGFMLAKINGTLPINNINIISGRSEKLGSMLKYRISKKKDDQYNIRVNSTWGREHRTILDCKSKYTIRVIDDHGPAEPWPHPFVTKKTYDNDIFLVDDSRRCTKIINFLKHTDSCLVRVPFTIFFCTKKDLFNKDYIKIFF